MTSLGISVEYYHIWRISPHKLMNTEQNLKQIWGRPELIPIKIYVKERKGTDYQHLKGYCNFNNCKLCVRRCGRQLYATRFLACK